MRKRCDGAGAGGRSPGRRWAPPAASREKSVVDQYFNAVKAKDNQTLTSFAAVNFDKKVESWKIKRRSPRTKEPGAAARPRRRRPRTPRPQLAANKKAATRLVARPLSPRSTQVREARKANKPVPAKLRAVAAEWDEVQPEGPRAQEGARRGQGRGREGEAQRGALGRPRRRPREPDRRGRSTKQIDLDLTIDGQAAALRDDAAQVRPEARTGRRPHQPLGGPEPQAEGLTPSRSLTRRPALEAAL